MAPKFYENIAASIDSFSASVDSFSASVDTFAKKSADIGNNIQNNFTAPLSQVLSFLTEQDNLPIRRTLNHDISRLSQSGPDFMSNMFSAYLLNMSPVKSRAVMSTSTSAGNTPTNTTTAATELFAFRCTDVTIPQSKAALLSPIKWGNTTIEKLSSKREGSHQSSITLRMDDHLRWWYLNDNFEVSKSHKTDTGTFNDDPIYQTIPHVFFPNTSYANPNDVSQTLIVSLANRYSTYLTAQQEANLAASGKNGIINTPSNNQISDFGMKPLNNNDIDYLNNISTTYPIYIFENVKFIGKPDITFNRDSSAVISGEFTFIFTRLSKQWIKFNWKEPETKEKDQKS